VHTIEYVYIYASKEASKHKKGVSRMAKVDKVKRNLDAAFKLREAAEKVWNERRKAYREYQIAMAVANWQPSEELVRGINVVLDASRKKKEELPIRFAENWHGELQRIGYKAVWRHCNRYGIAFSLEDVRDAIAEAVASLWEEGKLDSSLEQDELSLSWGRRILFCRDVVNAYRRYIHPGKTQTEFTLDIILGIEKYYQWRPEGPESALSWVELKESLRQTLSNKDYAACQLLLQGYNKGETARILKMARRTLRRRLDRLPSGKLLRILRT
jgi:hypothetical protein